MKKLMLIALFGVFSSSFAFAESVEWQLDNAHSTVGFVAKHFMISKVRGSFTEFSGKIMADPESGKLASAEGTVKIASVDTANAKRDEHLKAADFFDAEKYPEMKMITKSVVFDGDAMKVEADLTIKDVTKPVTLDGEYLGAAIIDFGDGPVNRSGFTLRTVINRKEFGLNFAAVANGKTVVSDDIEIVLEFEILKPAAKE